MSDLKEFTRRSFLANAAKAFVGLTTAVEVSGWQPSSKVREFSNARWFDGKQFRTGHFYSVGRVLAFNRPARIDSVTDLGGKYVIPPFGEAHNHNVEYSDRIDEVIRKYLREGIFYVKNPNNLPTAKARLAGKINISPSIDVTFANGGLTASGGHPLGVVRRNLERGAPSSDWAEGGFYFTIDNLADLNGKWEKVLSGKPDFIKTYLQYSEDYEKRKDDAAYLDWRALNPALLPEIVRRAHRAGLRVSTHVETAADFHNALVAGADEINHMPGFRPHKGDWEKYNAASFKISKADAQLAGRKRVTVVTTLVSAIDHALQKKEGEPFNEIRDLLVHNLQILRSHKVRIAIGSDSYRHTSLVEALNLRRLGVFDNKTLLKLWCEDTATAIFPRRKIGHLKDGYEASFLVLKGNPIEDFRNVEQIEMRVKQGAVLPLPN